MVRKAGGNRQDRRERSSPGVVSAKFSGQVVHLEIARGHDGLLRGPPDPVLLVGVYVCVEDEFLVLGRSLHRFRPTRPFPSITLPDAPDLPSCEVRTDLRSEWKGFKLLVVALEENGGGDVQRLFGALDHHDRLGLWAVDQRDIEPMSLRTASWRRPTTVELMCEGVPASTGCTSDNWIGAASWDLGGQAPRFGSTVRVPFLAHDRRNDWTAVLRLRC